MTEKPNFPTIEQVTATVRAEMETRMKAIVSSPQSARLKTLAMALAFDTNLPITKALDLLDAAKADLDRVAPQTKQKEFVQ